MRSPCASDQVPLRGPNNLVFDRHGGFYFTDLGKGRHRDLDRGAACYARADGSLIREVAFPMITANGIGLSPDGGVLYVAETEPGRLWAFDLDGPGEIRRQPWPSPHGDQDVGRAHDLADGGEVLHGIIGQAFENGRVDAVRVDGREHQRLPIWRCARDRLGADCPAGARLVLDDEVAPDCSVSRVATRRATKSVVPPGGYGTMMRTVRVGYPAGPAARGRCQRLARPVRGR